MTQKKIPYGISNFRTIVEDGYAYVDKTRFIRSLEDNPAPYVFFLRPRRFGKSLFVSLLNYYYDINERENFSALFSDTEIGREPTRKHNSYYVLNFNFSAITTGSEEDLNESFTTRIRDSLNQFIEKYHLDIQMDPTGSAADLLTGLFSRLPAGMNGQIFVIIDEYDHFANELLGFNLDLFQDTISRQGFIRKWYEALKIGTQTFIGRIFATGVSPITLDSLTSGFNIADDITRNPKFNEMMGFTEEEVRDLVTLTLPCNSSSPEMSQTLRQYYNGYLFSEDAGTRLFNSDMILYYLKSYLSRNKPPEKLLDVNISSDYGKMGRLLRIRSPNRNMEIMKEIVYSRVVSTRMTEQFSMERRFTGDDFKSLLFYLGLLTIKENMPGRVSLQTPNYVIHGLYYDFFLELIAHEAHYQLNTESIAQAIEQIAVSGRCDRLVALIEELLHAFSNRDYIGFDEKYIKIAIFAYAHMSNLYLVKSEYEVMDGYIDIAFLKREPWHPDYYAIFELKYLKMSECTKDRIKKVTDDGVQQLTQYTSSPELSAISNLKKWVLVFAGDRCVAMQEV